MRKNHCYYYSYGSFCLLTEPRQDQPLDDYLTSPDIGTSEMKPSWMSDDETDGQKIKREAVEEEYVSNLIYAFTHQFLPVEND